MPPACFRPIVSLAAAIIGLTGFVGVAACRAPQAGTATATTGSSDPYALMKQAYFDHAHQFEVALARGAEAGARRSLPDAQLAFVDRAVVTNLGPALRAIVVYRGEMPATGGGTRTLEAELRQYIHPAGMVVVEAACFSDRSSCDVPRELIERTDAAVLQHLADAGVEGMLPRDAGCEPASMPIGDAVHPVAICRPGPDVRLSVLRLARDETLAEFRWLAADPGSQVIGGQVALAAP